MKTRLIHPGRLSRALLLAVLSLFLFGTGASLFGQQGSNSWALKMFSELGTERSHNFGNVALHAETIHRFAFKNIYKEDIVLASAPQSNCSCTKPSASKMVIKSGETAEIIAQVDTSGKTHTGQRKATVTVRFSKPRYAEVQLQIAAYIRTDVIFEPGAVEFGGVGQGTSVSKKVYLQYNGNRAGWSLTGLKNTDTGVKAVAQEVPRQNGRKTYEVTVTLKDTAQPGYVNDLLRFNTNDGGANGQIFIPIRAQVLAPLSAKPSYFQLGVVHPGEQISKNLVIRGSSPFRIEKITSTDPRMKFLTANQESVVHVISVTFSADENPGAIHQMISVLTSQKEMPEVDISVFGFISDEPAILPSPYRNSAAESMSFAERPQDPQPSESLAQPLPSDAKEEGPNTPKLNRSLPLPGNRPKTNGERIAYSRNLLHDGFPFAGVLPATPDAAQPAPLQIESSDRTTSVSRPLTMTFEPNDKAEKKSDDEKADVEKADAEKTVSDGWEAAPNETKSEPFEAVAPAEKQTAEKQTPEEKTDDAFETVSDEKDGKPAPNDSAAASRPLFQKPVLVAERPKETVQKSGEKSADKKSSADLSESLLLILPE